MMAEITLPIVAVPGSNGRYSFVEPLWLFKTNHGQNVEVHRTLDGRRLVIFAPSGSDVRRHEIDLLPAFEALAQAHLDHVFGGAAGPVVESETEGAAP